MSSKLLTFRPPRIAQFLVAAAVLLHWAIPLRLELFVNSMVGTSLITIGLYTMTAGWWQFKKQRTVICPTGTPTSLVAVGIYAITRKPMYLGIFMMLLGLALIVGSIPFYAAAIAYFVVMDTVFCPYEEGKLLRLFGDEFVRYRTRVRRWL
ncbi:MAG: isoprenylcysteine carboxylmethyltransferase family protein [Gammaproteobacteria bacterium]|nr:isoprenylcysteine carboxylmethyltransferase family protein [Gammaproteobacteria bacterium]